MTNPSLQRSGRREAVALAVLCLAAFMASLDVFIVNVAFDAIGKDFGGADLTTLSWVLNAYAIVFAAFLSPRAGSSTAAAARAASSSGWVSSPSPLSHAR